MRRFAATVAYDGTEFFGSQIQPDSRSVQGELERAAENIFRQKVRVALAGRTDRGVHARGQVAAFNVDSTLDASGIERALNALLPKDVAVREVREVPSEFDPRRGAIRRWYRYTVTEESVRDPLNQRFTWQVSWSRDIASMRQAAGALVGTRSFAACAGALEIGRTPVRSVFSAAFVEDGPQVLFDIQANAFLPQMVRRLAGALDRVGGGRLSVEEFVTTLEAGLPCTIGPVAPPQGLCLERVWYDEGYPV